GAINSRPTNAVMAPAVCRINVPKAKPSRPKPTGYVPAAKTARATPGSLNVVAALGANATVVRYVTKHTATITGRVRAVNASALAPSNSSRRGTAASDARIEPDPYSADICSAPS